MSLRQDCWLLHFGVGVVVVDVDWQENIYGNVLTYGEICQMVTDIKKKKELHPHIIWCVVNELLTISVWFSFFVVVNNWSKKREREVRRSVKIMFCPLLSLKDPLRDSGTPFDWWKRYLFTQFYILVLPLFISRLETNRFLKLTGLSVFFLYRLWFYDGFKFSLSLNSFQLLISLHNVSLLLSANLE